MEMNDLSNVRDYSRRILIGGAIAMALIIAVSLIVSYAGNFVGPSVVSSTPKDGSSSVSPFSSVEVKFDREINQSNKSKFNISPDVSGDVQINSDTLTFTPSHDMGLGQRYTVTVSNPVGVWGTGGQTVSFSFTTRTQDQLDATDREKFQGESSKVIGDAAAEGLKNDPIIQRGYIIEALIEKLPYETDQYLIEYVRDKSLFYITIKENPFSKNKQAAIDWLKSQGIEDISWINVEYGSYKGVTSSQ